MILFICSLLVISRKGNEPKLSILQGLEEDMSLLGKKFDGMSNKRRRAYFSKLSNLEKQFYDPNLVYTFDLYQHIIHLSTFNIDIGMIKYDLLKFLDSKPFQLMAVIWDPLEKKKSKHNVFKALKLTTLDSNNIDSDDEENSDNPNLYDDSENDHPWTYLYKFDIYHERSLTHSPRASEGIKENNFHLNFTNNANYSPNSIHKKNPLSSVFSGIRNRFKIGNNN